MPTMQRGQLTVSAGPFRAAFRKLAKPLPKRSAKGAELVLRFEDGVLYIDGPGITVDVPASGSWPGQTRVPVSFARMLAIGPPPGDPLILEFIDGHLVLHGATTLRLTAAWEDLSPYPAYTILDLSDRELLKLQAREPPAAIVSGGLAQPVRRAEMRFQRAIGRAFKPFAEYGISREELEQAVRELIVDS